MTNLKCITIWCLFAAMVVGVWPAFGAQNQSGDIARLEGRAEDLWGSQYELSQFAKGVTIIQPFSPANCGYCLVDGEFVKENYLRNNRRAGGTNFLQCLFNPQLDIYTFQKHYRETSTCVLTFPLALHHYHRNGFPFLIAFQDGKLTYTGGLHPYEETFRRLRPQLWPVEDPPLTPTSPLHMATRFIFENQSELAVTVYADQDQVGAKQAEKRLAQSKQRQEKTPTLVKHESELSTDDYQKNLYFTGITEQFRLGFLSPASTPLRLDTPGAPLSITSSSIKIGDYEFPKSRVGLSACFPNPFNRERYVVLNLSGSNLKSGIHENSVDYTIHQDGANGRPEILLHGFFEKSGDGWRFSRALAYGKAANKKPSSAQGIRPTPSESPKTDAGGRHQVHVSSWLKTPNGGMKTLGTGSSRFPSLTVDKDGICWVAWEENGDILVASINRPADDIAVAVESDSSDSFNPVIAHDGSALWIFYLNNQDGFYRLYARWLDGPRLSDQILLTEREPFDVITPAVTSNQAGKIAVAWSEWKANFRFLRFRVIENRSLGNIGDAAVKQVGGQVAGYVNAWYPSLAIDESGQPWGAWNQHYPAILGVCAGNLLRQADSVTRLTDSFQTSENGGYPSMVIDRQGKKWVFWESFAWDVAEGIPQKVLGSWYDQANERWSLPYTISLDEQTMWNQTPRAAVDSSGTVWTVWSGRQNDVNKPWGIRVACLSNDRWSVPRLVSEEGLNARAPAIAIGNDAKVWLAWHWGTGEQMQIKVLEYVP